MVAYTQDELLNKEFKKLINDVLDGLLRTGLYIMGATSKVGKTMIATSLANAVANGTDYLGKANCKGKVVYYDNDNYEYEAKERVKALGFSATPDVRYVFGEDAQSLRYIKMDLQFYVESTEDCRLVIIDSFINLAEFIDVDHSYQRIYPILKNFRDFIVECDLVCIILHHTKKGIANGQDRLIGPKAMSGATSGSILLNVVDEFSKEGTLEFVLRHRKEIIPIKKDNQGIGWELDNNQESVVEEIPKSLLNLINTIIAMDNHELCGNSQEIVQKAKMEINPYALYKYLKKNKSILEQNFISFERIRTHESRKIIIRYEDEKK